MANPTCTKATLISAGACLSGKLLSEHDRKVLQVWFMAKQLAAIGGTNYTADLETLASDSNSLTCGFQPDDMATSELVIEKNNAVSAGASISSDKDTLAGDVKCLDNYSDFALNQMILNLRCKLGRGKAYPQ
jgi:hypothetical protein